MNFDNQLHHLIDEALNEDVGDGDHSSLSCIPPEARGKAVLKIKQDGVLAGMEIAKKIFDYKESPLCFNSKFFTPLLAKKSLRITWASALL